MIPGAITLGRMNAVGMTTLAPFGGAKASRRGLAAAISLNPMS